MISITDLTYRYRGTDKPALRDVNFKVEKGEFVVVTGPSGCGKSTLIRAINGLIPHFYEGDYEGKVEVCGINVSETPPRLVSQKVGSIFQFPEEQMVAMKVWRDVAFGPENLLVPREEILKRIAEVLEYVGVKHLRENYIYELSGGQKQRVAIASMMAMKPEVFLFDEPTSELDPLGAQCILDLVRTITRERKHPVVLVEHKLDEVLRHADRFVLMDEGRIVADDTPTNVLATDTAEKLGIGVPRVVLIAKELRRRGLDIQNIPLTEKETANMLQKFVR